MTTLSLERVSVEIGTTRVCRDLSLRVKEGEVWSILGRNGVGKSTLLKTLAGLRAPLSGSICLDDHSLSALSRRERARLMGILFQDSETIFPATVRETVLTGRHPWLSALQGEDAEDLRKAEQAMRRVGLDTMAARNMDSLSGGERRRADLAALIVQEPRILLLDEPSNHLDMHYQVAVLGELIEGWRNNNGVVVLVMHDVNLALRFSDHLMLLQGEGEVEWGTARDLATEPRLSRLYGHRMQQVAAPRGVLFYPT